MLRLPSVIAAVILAPACGKRGPTPTKLHDAMQLADAESLEASIDSAPSCQVECYADGSGSESPCDCVLPAGTTCPDGCHICNVYCFPNVSTPNATCPTCVTEGSECGSECYGLG